jgi:hypothetical protein
MLFRITSSFDLYNLLRRSQSHTVTDLLSSVTMLLLILFIHEVCRGLTSRIGHLFNSS